MTVQFNVAQLLREPIGAVRTYHVDEEYLSEAGDPFAVAGDLSLLRTDRSILVEARLETTVATECSRCLAPAEAPLTLLIEEEYFPTIDVVSGATLPAPEDPSAFRIDKHHVLDLDEAIRQQLLLAEPMQPLCRPDCAGLCPDCGADLNRGSCQCSTRPVDARWSALRSLADDSGARPA